MDLLKWDQNISLNNDFIDNQHKELFKIVNKLVANCNVNYDYKIIQNIIYELFEYTNNHFKEEERLLEERNYPHLEIHITEHAGFIKKLNDINVKLNKSKDKKTAKELLVFVKNWLLEHTSKYDLDYKNYI